ncbi:MAG: 3-phosphoshikimate 1-carboxyvinyltransferase, partial [Alphaproteobacteria bacterium]|nr:3-phosphoshikimate 1-carboxyvinyltransferase [Alphaproteobacteria bacterium]
VHGRGVGGLVEPVDVLDLGNAGTATRLLMGVLAGHPFTAILTGDASLRSRPMQRVLAPLAQMGARAIGRSGGRLPLAFTGTEDLVPIEYTLPVASAQVKSAVLLAGLHAPGATTVIEPEPTRDHTERMLRHFGATVVVEDLAQGARRATVTGQGELVAAPVVVPADPSSAAFPLVAAAMIDGSTVTLTGVCLNPGRAGLIDTLVEMGASLTIANRRVEGGEPVGDLVIQGGGLVGCDVPPERAPSMIDEYPILAVAATQARGTTRMRGLGELRVKESDRLAAVAEMLAAVGATVGVEGDDLIVTGGRPLEGGVTIGTRLDHRIAMSALVLGMVTAQPVAVDDARPIETSFPGFVSLMTGLGAKIGPV